MSDNIHNKGNIVGVFRIDYLIIFSIILIIALTHILFWDHFFNADFGADQRLYWNQGLYLYKDFQFLFNPAFGLYESYIPFIVYLSLSIFGNTYAPVIWYNIFLYAAMTGLIYVFTKDLFKNRLWAIAVVLLIISNNVFIQSDFLIARETTSIVFVTLFCIGFYYYFNNQKNRYLMFLSFLSVLLLLNDNRYFPYFLLFLFVWIGHIIIKRERVTKYLLFLALTILLLLPWSYRNYMVNGYFLPFSGARVNMYLKFLPESTFSGIDKEKLRLWARNADRAGMQGDSSLLNLPPIPVITGYARAKGYHNIISEKKYNEFYMQKPKSKFGRSFDYLRNFWSFFQFRYRVGPGSDDRIYPPWSAIRNINEIFHTGLMIPFFFAGFWYAAKKRTNIITILALAVLFHTVVHVGLGAHLIRYRYHIMPIFTIVAMYGIWAITEPLIDNLPKLRNFVSRFSV